MELIFQRIGHVILDHLAVVEYHVTIYDGKAINFLHETDPLFLVYGVTQSTRRWQLRHVCGALAFQSNCSFSSTSRRYLKTFINSVLFVLRRRNFMLLTSHCICFLFLNWSCMHDVLHDFLILCYSGTINVRWLSSGIVFFSVSFERFTQLLKLTELPSLTKVLPCGRHPRSDELRIAQLLIAISLSHSLSHSQVHHRKTRGRLLLFAYVTWHHASTISLYFNTLSSLEIWVFQRIILMMI